MDKELDRLVDLLVDHATVPVSGAKAAAEIGVPHSTLKDWVERLRENGVHVEGIHGRGFLLKAIPDILTSAVIRRAARGTQFGAQVHHYYRLGSTMDEAARLAQQGAPHGTLVLAEEQAAGRGRLGRAWHSPRGSGIYVSVLLRPPIPAARAPVMTLAAGLAAADAVSQVTGMAADLRWPNDVLLDGRKCCGILPEMTAELERIRHIVLGIGLNVNQPHFPAELRDEATSLACLLGRRVPRAEVLAALLYSLDRWYAQFLSEGSSWIIEAFQRRSSMAAGCRVNVCSESESYTGTTEGLDGMGFLLVRRDDTARTEPVLAGTVRRQRE